MTTRSKLCAATALSLVVGLGRLPAAAQTGSSASPAGTNPAAGASQANTLQEVVVTARRTAENLQTTPVAVTALNAKALDRLQIVNIGDVQRSTPNLSITKGAPSADSFAYIAIRGESNLQAGNANDPAVGIYIDGVYVPRPAGSSLDLSDVADVQVLRGPQGTLFGRNTTGGALVVTTNPPTDKFGGLLQGTFGNYDEKAFVGEVNLPIIGDQLDARVTYKYDHHDGYGYDPILNRPLNDLPGENFVRGELRFKPDGQHWDLLLTADYDRTRDSGQLITLVGFNPNNALFQVPGLGAAAAGFTNEKPYLQNSSNFYDSYQGTDPKNSGLYPHNELRQYGLSANLTYDLGWAKLKSITGYRNLRTEGYADLDASPYNILDTLSGYPDSNVSQEVQISGPVGDKFTYIGGVYYFHESGREFSYNRSGGILEDLFGPAGLVAPVGVVVPEALNNGDTEADSYAAYGQGTYKITDKLRFTGGARFTYDHRAVDLHNVLDGYMPADAPGNCSDTTVDTAGVCSEKEKAHFEYPAYTADLDYQATHNLFIYLKTDGADQSGGFNLRIGAIPAYQPESVRDIEGGIKTDFLDKRLRVDAAVFHSWESALQENLSTIVPGTNQTTQYIVNAGNAQITGGEVEVAALPLKGLELDASLGLLTGSYDSGSFNEVQAIAPGVNETVDRSGEPIPQLPKISYSFGATETVPTTLGNLSFHGDYDFIGGQHFFTETPAAGFDAASKQAFAQGSSLGYVSGYGLLNGKVTLTLDQYKVDLSIYARNITNRQYLSRTFADLYEGDGAGLGAALGYPGNPRTFGGQITYHFGG